MKTNLSSLNFKEILNNIEALFFDIDGVLSLSNVNIADDGGLVKTTNVKDAYAIKHAIRMGLNVCIISGAAECERTRKRYTNLGVSDIIMESDVKINDFENLRTKYNLKYENILYMGDDIPDYEIMKRVGLAVCPADASLDIKNISLYISDKIGGCACVRDVIEQVLRAKGLWMK